MGTRVLQLFLIALLTGCVVWASTIFIGPRVLTKYLENQAGDAVKVSGLKVTPKLAVTASRVQIFEGETVIASLRDLQVDWRLLRGDQPALLISVANVAFLEFLTVGDLRVTLTQTENGDPLKISGTAASAGDPNSFSAVDVKFDAHTDDGFHLLRGVTVTTGDLITRYPLDTSASMAKLQVDQVDLGANLLQEKITGTLALKNVVYGGPDFYTPEADIKFILADGLLSLSLQTRDLLSETVGLAVSRLSGSLEYDAESSQLASPIELSLNDFTWKDIMLSSTVAKISLDHDYLQVSAEGMSLVPEINLGRRYIGRVPDASFTAEFDASALGDNLLISGEARLAADQQPIQLDVSFQGKVANVNQPMACTKFACEISDVTYKYNLDVAGEMLSGSSRCQEPTCSMGGRTHDLSTKDTNKFFSNLQSLELISPLILGSVYAQILQGVAVGTGHKINF